ncbi:MAG: M64 family metallopeptidase, partial [Polyangiaceae bacterium]|nr:M64 family metallopeptidase [Polyangiaceae bacterium]
AALAPYDAVFVMVNSARYGGGGVFNQWSIFTSDNEYDDYVMLHEFGHHIGALADEYYSSSTGFDEDAMYPPGIEPWEPNITAFLQRRRDSIKWHLMIKADTPLPTPETEQYADTIGAFEGAGYKAKGLFRPQADCKMFHKGLVDFCAVCSKSLAAMVRYYAGENLEP